MQCHLNKIFKQAVGDPKSRQFLQDFAHEDALSLLPPVPMDVVEYVNTIINHFANAVIKDTTERLCSDACVKLPGYVLPIIEANIDTGKPCLHTIGIIASLLHFYSAAPPVILISNIMIRANPTLQN